MTHSQPSIRAHRDETVRSIHGARPDAPAAALSQPDALALLAIASSMRLEDPPRERERIILLGQALAAGRAASHALNSWLAQAISEHRGSHSAWDLRATSAQLGFALEEFERTVRETAVRLRRQIWEIAQSGPDAAPEEP